MKFKIHKLILSFGTILVLSSPVFAREINCKADVWYYGQTENNKEISVTLGEEERNKKVTLDNFEFSVHRLQSSIAVSIEDTVSKFMAAGNGDVYFSNLKDGTSATLSCL